MPKHRRLRQRILAFAGRIALVFVIATALPVAALRFVNPPTSSFILQGRIAHWLAPKRTPSVRQRWVDWGRIAPQMRLAVVAAEDQRFPDHWGFDVHAIANAVEQYEDGGRLRGASTISQQVAKNLFLWGGRSFVRKGIEAYFTVLLEAFCSKRRILEFYLNLAQFGPGVYGVDAASHRYFDKPPARLSAAEAALLAAALPNPAQLRVSHPDSYMRERQRWILGQMTRLGGPAYLGKL